jgi:hypothetical protein
MPLTFCALPKNKMAVGARMLCRVWDLSPAAVACAKADASSSLASSLSSSSMSSSISAPCVPSPFACAYRWWLHDRVFIRQLCYLAASNTLVTLSDREILIWDWDAPIHDSLRRAPLTAQNSHPPPLLYRFSMERMHEVMCVLADGRLAAATHDYHAVYVYEVAAALEQAKRGRRAKRMELTLFEFDTASSNASSASSAASSITSDSCTSSASSSSSSAVSTTPLALDADVATAPPAQKTTIASSSSSPSSQPASSSSSSASATTNSEPVEPQEEAKLVHRLVGHGYPVYAMCVLSNGWLATGGADYSVRVWS